MGHDIRIHVTQPKEDWEFEGIKVMCEKSLLGDCPDEYGWADLVYTHLGKAGAALNRCKAAGKPLVYYAHNDFKNVNIFSAKTPVIYNSEWVKESVQYPGESIVVHPIVDIERFQQVNTLAAEYVTMININKNKGGAFLAEIAGQLPKIPFLGVQGSYGSQHQEFPDNVTIVENTESVEDVYAISKALIMPSKYESYGRTAVEAMAAGVPVLCNDLPGLREACGDAAWYPEAGQWKQAIEKVYTGEKIAGYLRSQGRERTNALIDTYKNQMDELNEFLKIVTFKKTKDHENQNSKTHSS